ncbi:MAG: polysaccharide pyruvyl transferase family protein [Phycisphaerae bacterium]|nr:polysaccharide pyruvyl transferase family protein [Phycisphaerae bacterium]
MSDNNSLFILAGNGSNYNRGCEAILRGTVRILRNHFDNPRFLVVSSYESDEEFKQQCLNETDASIIHKKMYRIYKRFDFLWFLTKVLRVTYPKAIKHVTYKDLKPYLSEAKAVLALGGDNYSLGYNNLLPRRCTNLDDLVVARGKPLVIWGASVGPFGKIPAYERYMINHLRKVHIFARETSTIEYLAGKGLTNNVYRVADPAFLMEPDEPKQKGVDLKIEKGAIGLNLSSIMKRYIANDNIKQWIEMSADIISKIMQKTGRPIYLIPHVLGNIGNNDYLFLKNVLSTIPNHKDQVVLIPPIFNASETKWIISKMSIFAGARTHSTIASLSSCVPTLSFAYSMKAKGLNKDIFGHTGYCLSPDELTSDIVSEKILEVLRDSKEIKKHLEQCIPEVKDLAMNSGNILQEILRKKSPLD